MTSPDEIRLSDLLAQVYQAAYAIHGDLDLELTCFAERLRSLLESHLELADSISCRLDLLNSLYATDLYLSMACAQASDAAWRRFLTIYEKRILQFAIFITRHRGIGHDLADNVITDLFLPDTTGTSRMASYDGRRALIVWLRAVVSHQASNQRELVRNHRERVEAMPDCGTVTVALLQPLRVSSSKLSESWVKGSFVFSPRNINLVLPLSKNV